MDSQAETNRTTTALSDGKVKVEITEKALRKRHRIAPGCQGHGNPCALNVDVLVFTLNKDLDETTTASQHCHLEPHLG